MSDSEKDQNAKTELKKRLTPLQYHVTQEKGTERAFTGKYYKTTDAGTYTCVVCGEELFSSETKFDSGCGWPAFSDVLDQGKVKLTKDTSHVHTVAQTYRRMVASKESQGTMSYKVGGNLLLLIANPGMIRTEVTCAHCGAHLGHVFNDGPKPKLRRFCINSASLNFHPADGSSTAGEDVTVNGQ